jgi:hypothetical protein
VTRRKLLFAHYDDRGVIMGRAKSLSASASALLATALIIGMTGPAAHADFPYPKPSPSPSDPYDYGAYMKLAPGQYPPNDLQGKEGWQYSSKTACDPGPQQKTANCSPAVVANPQEQFGVTGMSVDKAWETTTGRPDVVISVHDSGIEWDNVGPCATSTPRHG